MTSLGINIGSSTIKLIVLDSNRVVLERTVAHEGNFLDTLEQVLKEEEIPQGTPTLVTGTEGRHLLNIHSVIESICTEEALRFKGLNVDAVVSLGGEHFVVYTYNDEGKTVTSFSGSKCASGTGEFFRQQLGRMDMTLEDIETIPTESKVHSLSSRCSVFMKSDCTHKLNKGEASTGDIVLSLSDVMATKVVDFLDRARIRKGKVLLAGGLTRNSHILRFLEEKKPDIDFIVPQEAASFEALGAAVLAEKSGQPLPSVDNLFREGDIGYGRYAPLRDSENRVEYLKPRRGSIKSGGKYILGIDGGSTTTKVALMDAETDEIVASHYGRTHGDPVRALKKCIVEIQAQIRGQVEENEIEIILAATTGSSREILGVFLETDAVYNEIIAHAYGTTYFRDDIDTIFEIGGQDAKYVSLKNKVPIDYAMNEACSAGTGSFIEESASGDLNITDVTMIGEIAMAAERPLKFGEHCSAFINSDIRKAVQYGASREDITAGIVTSIVSNYLNRVVGNRSIGQSIVLQGGVAKNRAIPAAFAMLLDKNIIVPPDPELLGAFGVAILAKEKLRQELVVETPLVLDEVLESEIVYEREFICRSCDNYCPIRVLKVNDNRYMFGGRCNKYANSRKKKKIDSGRIFNYIDERDKLLFQEYAPSANDFIKKKEIVVGIPRAFSIYSLWPLYSWFFHELGIPVSLSRTIEHRGVARVESDYCFPAEIAHGTVQSSLNEGVDYIFVPHFRDMPSYEKDVHANFCPITQALPYYISKAFPEVEESRFLTPVVTFKFGLEKALEGFMVMKEALGVSESELRKAFMKGYEKQQEFQSRYQQMGKEALEKARRADHPVIAVFGRPYNAFTGDANMGIPLKFTSRGFSVIPFDMLPFEGTDIFENMYWYYGQQNMHSSVFLKNEPNIFVTYITNFSCAPDSFILHYIKWIMGTKPFLILELDSHSADAGIDTRVEAFLDIIEGYRKYIKDEDEDRYDNGLRFINNGNEPIHVFNEKNNERMEIFGNDKVELLLSNMGQLSTELLAASLRGIDVNAQAMPLPDIYTLQIAKSHMSGKECLPAQLVLGSALKYLSGENYDPEKTYLLFVPTTTGPCRTGQYSVFYRNLFRDLELKNVVVITLDSDNSYNELGSKFSMYAWWGLVAADYMKDVETALRTCAVDPVAAMETYTELWQELVTIAEKSMSAMVPALRRIAREISRIPLKKSIKDVPKVLVVGEIYVRRDDFAVEELVKNFSEKGIIAKVSGIAEWIHYCDYNRKHDILKRLRLKNWLVRPFTSEFREYLSWKIETMWKHGVEKKVRQALEQSGLLPSAPEDIDEIMENTERYFVNRDLYSEISISSGVASTAMQHDYSGIVNISPFACLIGRVIQGLITPWARERNYPVISVEIDGDVLPPNIVHKLEIFMLNVLRFRNDPETAELIEIKDEETVSCPHLPLMN